MKNISILTLILTTPIIFTQCSIIATYANTIQDANREKNGLDCDKLDFTTVLSEDENKQICFELRRVYRKRFDNLDFKNKLCSPEKWVIVRDEFNGSILYMENIVGYVLQRNDDLELHYMEATIRKPHIGGGQYGEISISRFVDDDQSLGKLSENCAEQFTEYYLTD